MGQYPVETVRMMASIVETAERAIRERALAPLSSYLTATGAAAGSKQSSAEHHAHLQMNMSFPSADYVHHALALSAHVCAQGLQAKAMIVVCLTHDMGCYVSKLRPLCPVIAVTPSARLHRLFQMNYGLIPLLIKPSKETSSDRFIVYAYTPLTAEHASEQG
jgi:pyruvate kinase